MIKILILKKFKEILVLAITIQPKKMLKIIKTVLK